MSYAGQQDDPKPPIAPIQRDRQYTSASPYLLPTDDQEIQRLDFQHYALRSFCHGQLAFVPIFTYTSHPRILDVGTGSGRWVVEVARENPGAQVWGVDIKEPPQYIAGMMTGNCRLQYGNVLEQLPFLPQSFDLVHQRLINFGVPQTKWQGVLAELLRVTRIGGWLELMEWTGDLINPPTQLAELVTWVQQAAWQANGINLRMGAQVASMLQWSRCMSVQTLELQVPMGAHGERIGNLMQKDSLALIKGLSPIMAKFGIATIEQVQHHLDAVEVQLANPTCACFLPLRIAIGQRTP